MAIKPKHFRIDDLGGGINLTDYASEIEDKQCLDAVNFNFKGNTLCSSSGLTEIYPQIADAPIQAITVDDENIWHISSGSIYKNGELYSLSNTYTFTIDDLDGEIFSLGIDGNEKVFKIGFFNNEPLAKTTFETEMQTWLGVGYNFNYISGNDYTIERTDSSAIIFSSPNLSKDIVVSDWDEHSKLTLVIDGVSVTGDGATYGNAGLFLDYVVTQLPPATYYTDVSGGTLTLARIDSAALVISKIEYDRYTYDYACQYIDTANSGQYWDYTDTTIDGITYRTDGSKGRDFRGNWIIDKMSGTERLSENYSGGTATTGSIYGGVKIYNQRASILGRVEVSDNDGTCRLLDAGGSVLATETIIDSDPNYVDFNYPLAAGTFYRIECNDFDIYSKSYSLFDNGDVFDIVGGSRDGIDDGTIWNIQAITIDGTLFSTAYSSSTNVNTGLGEYSHLYIHKNDYSTMSISDITHFTNEGSFPAVSFYNTSVTQTIHRATVSVLDHNEIAKSNVNNGSKLDDKGLYGIQTHNYGILIYSRNTNELNGTVLKNPRQLFIDNDKTIHQIPSSIGEPSVGTIYNGKIIFGGYYQNGKFTDNITFSKTSDPLIPQNIYDFSGFDAGSQSISNGNTGRLVGFIVNEDGLLVFKNNEIWKTNSETITDTVFNFNFTKVSSNGALNQQCIAEYAQETFYYDHKNRAVRRLSYEENLTTLKDRSISREIEDILRAIPDDTDSDNYSSLINMSFNFPLLTLNIPTIDSPKIYIDSLKSDDDWLFRAPIKELTYNVEEKSWATENDKGDIGNISIVAYKGYFGTDDGRVMKDDERKDCDKEGFFKSKEYTFGDDIDYKKYLEIEIAGDIIPHAGKTKNLELQVRVDGELVDLGGGLTKRVISATDSKNRYRERIELYDFGEAFIFEFIHNGDGKTIISDVNIKYAPDRGFHEYY